jgi:hypothetical protein
VLQDFVGDGLVVVNEAKSGGSRTPGVGEVREVFTLGDGDGEFTALGAMFFILSAFVLGVLLDTKSLHGGIEKLGETFGVEAVVVDPNSFCHCGCGRNQQWWFVGGRLRVLLLCFCSRWGKAGGGILQWAWMMMRAKGFLLL